jgi:hypothetical protein
MGFTAMGFAVAGFTATGFAVTGFAVAGFAAVDFAATGFAVTCFCAACFGVTCFAVICFDAMLTSEPRVPPRGSRRVLRMAGVAHCRPPGFSPALNQTLYPVHLPQGHPGSPARGAPAAGTAPAV